MTFKDKHKKTEYQKTYMKDYMKTKRKEIKQNQIYKNNYDKFVKDFKLMDRVWYARHVYDFKNVMIELSQKVGLS